MEAQSGIPRINKHNTTNSPVIDIITQVRLFGECLERGTGALVDAAKIYAETIAMNRENRKVFIDTFPNISRFTWHKIELLGRGLLCKDFLIDDGIENVDILAKLDIVEQERICNGEKMEMLTDGNDIVKVDVRDLPRDKVLQMVDGKRIRSIPEQKLFLIEKRERQAAKQDMHDVENLPYVIQKNKVLFRRNVSLSKKQLLDIAVLM